MRVLLDLQGCQSASRLRGIGRYTLSLGKAIARNAGEHEIWLLLSSLFPDTIMPLRREFRGLVPQERIAVFTAEGPVGDCDPTNAARARFAELVREYAIAELQPDVVHVGSLVEGCTEDAVTSVGALSIDIPTAVTLYDLIPLMNPDRYIGSAVARNWYGRKMESLKRADLLLAISQSAGDEATASLGIPPERVINISAAADERFRPAHLAPAAADMIRRRFGISSAFLMYVGVIEPRKNFEGLIGAYGRLPEELRASHQLVLIAQGDEHAREALRRLGASVGLRAGDLIIADHVSDDDLVSLYSLCHLFVFPSFHEGFGLPALEAMSCGAAVIGSNATSIPEVVGRADALFDPTSPAEMARVMRRALTDEGFHRAIREHAVRRARKFSWDISAARAIQALEELYERKRFPKATRDRSYRRLLSAVGSSLDPLTDAELFSAARAIAANRHPSGPRQLLVDVSVLAQRDAQTGIQRVTRAVLMELLSQQPPGYRVEPIRLDPGSLRYCYARAFTRALTGQPSTPDRDEWVEVFSGDIFLGLDLGAHLVPLVEPWFLALRQRGIRVVFVVYDILPLRHPEWWRPAVSEVFEQWFTVISRESDLLVGISAAVAEDIRLYLDEAQTPAADKPQIAYFHLGADIDSSLPTRGRPPVAAELIGAIESCPTFLMVGTVEPRKGYAQVLAAFDGLWAEGLDANLVIVGQEGWLIDDLANELRTHALAGRRLFWLEGISDEYLEELYSASTCLICASEGEGFGLPLVEAARHKLPIIARDIPVFREVAESHAFYFSGRSADALGGALRDWLALKQADEEPVSDGMTILTWAESTRQLITAVFGEDDAQIARSS